MHSSTAPGNCHSQRPPLCPDGWPAAYKAGDMFCPMCGQRLLDFRVDPTDLFFLMGVGSGVAAAQKLKFDNTRSVQPVLVKLESCHPALEFEPPSGSVVECEVREKESCEITVRVNPQKLGQEQELRTELRVSCTKASLAPTTIQVRVGHEPKFECEIPPLATLKLGTKARTVGRLRQVAGVPVRLRGFTFNRDALSQVGLSEGQTFERGAEASFEIHCNADQLPRPGKHSGKLLLNWEIGPPTEIEVPIEMEEPPLLKISPAGQREIPQGLLGDVYISLRNDGGGTIEIASLEVRNCPEWFHLGELPRPCFLAHGGEPTKVHCEVDAGQLLMGTQQLTIIAKAVDGREDSSPYSIQITECEPYPHSVGIDFGTTNSCVAYRFVDEEARIDEVRMVQFRDSSGKGHPQVPSVAYFDEAKERWLAGFEAIEMAERTGHPERLVHSVKRLLNEGKGGVSRKRRRVEVPGRICEPEEVATAIILYLKRHTERQLKGRLDKVMVTVPANFTDTGVQAVLSAARNAGMAIFQTDDQMIWREYRLDEPTAAAIDANGRNEGEVIPEKSVLVFDFGGGTLDVSVLLVIQQPDLRQVRVLAHKGANWLGGDDFNTALMRLIADKYTQQTGNRVQYDVQALKRADDWDNRDDIEQADVYFNQRMLWEASDKAKVRLSTETEVNVPVTLKSRGRKELFSTSIRREEFESAVLSLVDASLRIIERAIQRARPKRPLEATTIEEVIPTGGTCLIPLVRKRLAEYCGRKVEQLATYPGFDEKQCVSRGACLYGVETRGGLSAIGYAQLECVGIHEVTNCSYGIGVKQGVTLARPLTYVEIVPEGSSLGTGDGQSAPESKPYATVDRYGAAEISIYQHTGDAQQDTSIRDNPDIVHLDTIEISKVRVKDSRKLPPIEIRMWLENDGMLEAEAVVEGHPKTFKLPTRFRPKED